MTNKTKACVVACSAILGFATTAMTQTAPQSPSNPSGADKKIVVTGCLTAAPSNSAASTATGTSGTAGTAGTAGTTGTAGTAGETTAATPTFQLTSATVAAADSVANAAGAATTDSATAAAGQTFRLIANPTALSPHVGKKLALTGTLEPQDSNTASAATAAGSEAKVSALRVESGKVIAESCAQQ
jgi:hypothetical protein